MEAPLIGALGVPGMGAGEMYRCIRVEGGMALGWCRVRTDGAEWVRGCLVVVWTTPVKQGDTTEPPSLGACSRLPGSSPQTHLMQREIRCCIISGSY